ncbi:MAG: hypothetical protein ACR2GJ_02390 [Gemmatimonadaceae bacterium]
MLDLWLPDRFFAVGLIRRATWLWVGARLILAVLSLLASAPVVPTTPAITFFMALLVAGLAAIEARRRREFLLLANLGVAPSTVVMLGAVTALVLELMLAAVVAGSR